MRDVYYSHDDADLQTLIAACDAALDWADANARAFPIETAPGGGRIQVWDAQEQTWCSPATAKWFDPRYTHWTPLPPPPSNPPLPEPLERLGAVLRKVKGVG